MQPESIVIDTVDFKKSDNFQIMDRFYENYTEN